MKFSDLSFKNKIFLLVALPSLGFLLLSIILLKQNYVANQEVESLARLTHLSITYSELVHELQIERSATSGFLGSQGEKFANELRQQRRKTDKKRQERKQFLSENTFKDRTITKLNQEVAGDLNQLNQIRSKVDTLNVDAKQINTYYNKLNATLLSISALVAEISHDADITKQTIDYYNFLQGKERAGIEYAILTHTFALDKFSDGKLVKFVALVTEQDTYMENFLIFATKENIAYYKDKIDHPAVKEVMRLRDIAKHNTSNFDVDPLYWFQQDTLRIGQLEKVEHKISTYLLKLAKDKSDSTFSVLIIEGVLTLLLMLLVIVFSIVSIKNLTARVNELTFVMKKVRDENDLTVRTTLEGKSELGQICGALNLTLDQFSSTISEISTSSLALSEASGKTSTTCEYNAEMMMEQQVTIGGIAAAVEELSATVKEVAGNTQMTADSAKDVNIQAQKGLDVVQLSYQSIDILSQEIDNLAIRINNLHESSGNITNVVDVIKSVAEQTNLLALNAAIEAARAGEQGRGFAVVADEVRTLAQRTQQSTSEIEAFIGSLQSDANAAHQVIEESQKKASEAVENSKNVEHTLEEITNSISYIFSMTEQVATAVEEQSIVTQEAAQNIVNIEQLSTETTAGATEIASTAKEQATLASAMQDLASRFRI